MVTPDPPVKDVKNAQATAVTIAGPPRREPNNAAKTPDQPFRRASFGQKVAGQREQRHCRENWIDDQRIMVDGNRGDGIADPPEQDQSQATHGHERGHSQQGCRRQKNERGRRESKLRAEQHHRYS